MLVKLALDVSIKIAQRFTQTHRVTRTHGWLSALLPVQEIVNTSSAVEWKRGRFLRFLPRGQLETLHQAADSLHNLSPWKLVGCAL